MTDGLMTFPALPIHPPRSVEAKRGWAWLKEGWIYFKRAPLIWLAMLLVVTLIGIGIAVIPLVGPIVNALLPPVWSAGVMVGCHALHRGQPLTVRHLFAGFGPALKPLVLSGLILIALELVVVLLAAGPMLLSFLAGGDPAEIAARAQENPVQVLLQVTVLVALMVPIAAAAWYSPALIVLSNQGVADALKLSLKACFVNIWPLLVWGIVSTALAFLGSIPFGLGLLVVLPMMMVSVYLSYRDIFTD